MSEFPNMELVAPYIHPYTKFQSGMVEVAQAPEMVVDDVIVAGACVVAGERAIGKTSALVPLLLTATGLLQNWPLTAKVRRRVIYVSEDLQQVQRIITGLQQEGYLTCSKAEFDDWFKLVDAERMPAAQIAKAVPSWEGLWTNQMKSDGTEKCAPPVVCLDTTNATIEITEGNNNSEISAAIATLRQSFKEIPLVLVGHVSKASRGDIKNLTMMGAFSWEGDTQQTVYLAKEDEQRYLILGKNRFGPKVTEYLLHSHCAEIDAIDAMSDPTVMRCFFAVPEASSKEARDTVKKEQKAEQYKAKWHGLQKRLLDLIKQDPGINSRNLRESVEGKATTIKAAIAELEEAGVIRIEDGPKNSNLHYPIEGTTGNHWQEITPAELTNDVPF